MKQLFFILFTILIFHSAFFFHHSAAGVIQLPQTGQSKCYDTDGVEICCAGTGQDGNLRTGVAWPNPRFSVSGECVTDNLTGLMWAKDGNLPLPGARTWQGALDRVDSLNSGGGLCGYTDWRLPNRKELMSLVNRHQSSSASWLNAQGFSNVQDNWYYWSSSSYALDFTNAWAVDMVYGVAVILNKMYGFYVWPVRLGQ